MERIGECEIEATLLASYFLHQHRGMEYSTGTFLANFMPFVMNDSVPLGFSRYGPLLLGDLPFLSA